MAIGLTAFIVPIVCGTFVLVVKIFRVIKGMSKRLNDIEAILKGNKK